MTAWGGVLNLKFPARGFWPDEMRNWHITHLELEAVYKTVQAFLKELESKVVCDNHAVLAMLSRESKPTFEMLQQRCEFHFVNVLKQGELQQEATDSAAAAHDMLKENNDKKKIVCVTCTGNGHATEACWLTNPAKLEDYVKRFPTEETRICAAVEERRKELKVTASQGGGVGYVEVWNLETKQTDKVLIEAQYLPDSPFNMISTVALEDTYDLYATFVEQELQSGDGTTRYELVREDEVLASCCLRAVHIQEWLLQYDNRLTVSENDPSVYFIDIPNVLMVQLNFSIDDVPCIISSEEWRTTFLKAFNAKLSRS
ncbi:hypothetical protein CYMTET_4592 [Cymbomonas tetramitiformis]|uniref:Uncharacterized protein n=1 Tax=Cymbomonas tetramitiformis TaxID=36881 RepID=A0AAE0LKC1_9CHLO|nr:hypothetical protein CYMTET_4592 [Cymbomonas tetramitiformis]